MRATYKTRKGGKGYLTSIKSKEYRVFEEEVWIHLNQQVERIGKLSEAYVHGENFFVFEYIFRIPAEKYYRKDGAISKTSGDIDNFIKPLNDQIFKGMAQINKEIDDSAIVGLKAIKLPHELPDYKIIIGISLLDKLDGVSIY